MTTDTAAAATTTAPASEATTQVAADVDTTTTAAAAATTETPPGAADTAAKGDADKAAADKAAADLKQTHETEFAKTQADTLATVHQGWVDEAKADPEFGGEHLAENLAKAKASMEATASPKLIALLDKTGLGDHAEVIRLFLKVGPAFAPDKFVPSGKEPLKSDKSAAKVLYPSMA